MAEQTQAQREAALFTKFLETKKVLIADSSAASRSGLFQAFSQLGAKAQQLVLVNSFNQAQNQIVEVKPEIVVAEYDLGKRCGLELLQSQREQRAAETKDCVFVIVTSNTSQTAVARAAEEDVDAYVIKPYTPETLRKTLMTAVLAKTKPSPYNQSIEQAKEKIAAGALDEAQAILTAALEANSTPALAHYYLGQIEFLRKVLDKAQGSYEKGLEYNKIHYKCMVGLYELLMSQREHGKAYDVVKRISQYFPANPKRLAEVLRLAIVTAQYADIEKYYAVFSNIDERDETLIRYVSAALVVCGKYYLSAKLGNTRAIELFQKAATTSYGTTKTLKEIVFSLLEYSLIKEAEGFMKKFPPESFESDDFLLSRFFISDAEGKNSLAIDQGRALIAKGATHDERLYLAMIRLQCQAKMFPAAEQTLHEATLRHPDKQAIFEEVFKENYSA